MPAAWQPTKRLDWCLLKDAEKEEKTVFTDKVWKR